MWSKFLTRQNIPFGVAQETPTMRSTKLGVLDTNPTPGNAKSTLNDLKHSILLN